LPSDEPEPIKNASNRVLHRRSAPENDQRFWLRRIHEITRDLLELEEDEPVARGYGPQEMPQEIDINLNSKGHSSARVLNDLAMVARMTPKTSSRRFFNQLFAGRDGIATAAEILTTVLNSSMYTHKIAGINANIEDEVIQGLLPLVGFNQGDGSFFPGGSISNLVSLVLARENARTKMGSAERVSLDKFTAYTSECCHYSVVKNASITGIPRENVRKIPVDSKGRMSPEALSRKISEDKKSGFHPFLISATSGTTVIGAFDPLTDLADLAQEHGLWLHVDAALGGGVMFSKKQGHLLNGVKRADSLAWSAHKMMGVPLSCSVLLVKRRGALEECLAAEADYLFQAEDQSMDFGQKSIQCGRRNDALKLWSAWRHRGSNGMAARVDRLFELAQLTAKKIAANPELELAIAPDSINVCFRTLHSDPAEVCSRLAEEQSVMVGHAKVHGKSVIRVPHVNPDITEEDIDFLLSSIVEIDAACAR
jgi:sulfinoalanine decarboxylase